MPELAPETPGEIWFEDEARIGQKNCLVRQWARRGTRPRQPADQRYESALPLRRAICPAQGKGAALALPFADTEAMQLHLDEISRNIAVGAHAVLLFDRGWHTTPNLVMPKNVTPIWLPSRAPELNAVENIWQYLRQTWLSNRVRNLRRHRRRRMRPWNKLTARPDIITSIGMRHWAHVGQR